MTESPTYIAGRMQVGGNKTLEFFRELTPDQWGAIMYTEGSVWTVREVLAHFVSAESGMTRLVESILTGGPGAPEDFDLNAYNERKVASLKNASTDELLGHFTLLREKSTALAANLSPDDLTKTGRHPWLGMASIADILKMMYRHNQIHLRDIRRAMNSSEPNQDG
ncbi:MAG: hypothetical protein A2Z16_15565 [Chloroflexi bacterium RBG_16_54_18]|nr:MAG: hypothetical protein A2Z16_15565 [Chloroflexi bacterium RBG_16_54_18]